MQLGCDHCGFVENESEFHARGRRALRCPGCSAPLTRISLASALKLAREAAEAEAWREQAGPSAASSS